DLLWVGTDGNGVYRYITKGNYFSHTNKGPRESRLLGHNIVRSVLKDRYGNLWVGTRGDGLNLIPPGKGPRISYNINSGLSNNAVLALKLDHHDNLWIGVDGEGIDMLEYSTGRFFHFPEDFVNTEILEFGSVYAICIDVYGSIWLGTSGFGVVNLVVRRNYSGEYVLEKFKQIRFDPNGEGLRSDIVYSIVEERPNVLWLGTRGGGLHRLNTMNNSFEIFTLSDNIKSGPINDDVLSLCLNGDQELWIGTSGGLSVLDLSYKPYQFKHYTERDGMPNNTVHGIMVDKAGAIWISTNNGLGRLNTTAGTFMNFNKTDGLLNIEFADGAVFNDTVTNSLYFGGFDGLDWFNPVEITVSDRFPPLFLSDFHLNNKLITPGDSTGILKKSLNSTDQIELRYDQNFFSFSFTSLNYKNPQKCEFAYYLEGFDADWNYVGNLRLASFTNVPPGYYTLKVKATNEDLVYGDEIKAISILIHRPYWNTLVAYLIYFILLGLIGTLIVRFLIRRVHENNQAKIEKLEYLKAKEINQYKLQFFTNIAHEFRTPLTLIMAPAAILEQQLGEKEQLGQYARSIYQNAHRLHRLISELIEFRKVETENMKLSVGKYELVQYIFKLSKAFEYYAKHHDLTLRFLPSNQLIEAWVDLEKFEKILLNLVSNAFKFTPAGGIVEIELSEKDEHIVLLVRDTGIGIPTDSLEKIFERFYYQKSKLKRSELSQESSGVGLSLTKSLVELHKGTISARNLPSGGSEFCVKIPNRKEDFGQELVDEILKSSIEKITMKVEEEFHITQVITTADEKINPKNDQRHYSLLVVDDNYEVCNLIESLLVEKYIIFKAYDGNMALDILANKPINLVISDVIMPRLDGLELTSLIKSDINTSHIPVILLTARGELDDRIEGLEVGADSYIPKPFNPRHLMIRIEKLLANIEHFRNLFSEYDTPKPSSELLARLGSGDQKLLTQLIEYIEDHMHDSNLNADHLSDHIAMSKTQLYRKIKALTDLTPHGLIKYLRLKKAAKELKLGEKNVSEVFYETGFNNRSYFYRSFKEAFGVSPGSYCKTYGGDVIGSPRARG
ncbi:MAG: response regulator, partial [Bacteroidales bacterium]|nr:response regulator [Bacteroidales bacterium]